MEQSELLVTVCEALESLGIDYLVTGSVATITYGEPRHTNDIDIVVRLGTEVVDALVGKFPAKDFYISVDAAMTASRTYGQFNLIHPSSGLKVDFMVADSSPFNAARFKRGRRIAVDPDYSPQFAAPEDVILKKLEYYTVSGGDRHIRDICGVLKVSREAIDDAYLRDWIDRLGVASAWAEVERAMAT